MNRFAGKCAVVTGGTSGIGAAVVSSLIMEGAAVGIITCAPAADVDEFLSQFGPGAQITACRADVADAEAAAKALTDISGRIGDPDILINCAGIWQSNPVPESSLAVFDRHIDVNLKGPFYLINAALPAMIRRGGGCIINVGSVSGISGRAGDSAYSASKAGLAMLTRTLAAELGARGIRMNCVCPGAVATPLTADLRTPEGEQAIKALMADHPSPRRAFFMEAQQLADIILFLASPESSAIHGAVIVADEGLTATM